MTKTNNIGFLRLLFAYLVILSHSPQMIDGNISRELIFLITGTTDLGALAVSGFFLISGYLIMKSYENSGSFFNWLMRRILRIYPAFVVVWIVCVFIVVPLAGASQLLLEYSGSDWAKMAVKVLFLSVPHVNELFEVTNIVTLNGSLWTIRYEFLCYLLIPLIALFRLTKKNILITLSLSIAVYLYTQITVTDFILETPFTLSTAVFSKLSSAFLFGMCFYKYREQMIWNHKVNFICFILLITLITNPIVAELVFILFGGYLLFNFAFNYRNAFIEKINNSYDISYGVYIYAWPIQTLIIQNNPTINPWALSIMTILLASFIGYLSWKLVEKPFLHFKRYFQHPNKASQS